MLMSIKWVVFLILVAVAVGAMAEDVESWYVKNDVPPLAVKGRPFCTMLGDTAVDYKDPASHARMAREEFYGNGQLKSRFLYKAGKRYGLQRTWFENGLIEKEERFTDGVMNGLFRTWDEKGKLVANYTMNKGTGLEKVFYSSGGIKEEMPYVDNARHGIGREYFESGQIMSFAKWDHGEVQLGIDFIETGDVVLFQVRCKGKLGSGILRSRRQRGDCG